MPKISYEINPDQSTTAIANLLKAVEHVLEARGAVVADSPDLMNLQTSFFKCRGLRSDGRSLELFGGDRR